MQLEAQDSIKLIIMMAAGAAFAGVGLWLLLRPKPTGSAAKIELFGLKFESSSAGLLVFLIGAVFLVIPLFVPEKVPVSQPGGGGPTPIPADKDKGSELDSGKFALVLPSDPQIKEKEKNDRLQTANQAAFGQTVAGDVKKGEADWFVVAVPEDAPRFVELRMRHVRGAGVVAHIYNARERKVAQVVVSSGADYGRVEVSGNDRFYVRVGPTTGGFGVDYEMTLLPVKDD